MEPSESEVVCLFVFLCVLSSTLRGLVSNGKRMIGKWTNLPFRSAESVYSEV